MTSNPQFNVRTSGLEVAKTFGDQIRGKNGEQPQPSMPLQNVL